MQRFQIFLEHIWILYVSYVVPIDRAPEDADVVRTSFREFLSVPETALAISVRHVEDMPHDMNPCVVCLGALDVEDVYGPSTVLALACGHIFHRDCLQQWCAVAATCP
ncbi:hypothetical protein SDRG_13004, partial [Saprolegnia diclina VS20]